MTMTWALKSDTSDLIISNGKLVTLTGADEVQQRILVTLNHHWQEYFLNVPAGVPWYDLILGGKDLQLYEAILRTVISSVPGVVSILDFTANLVNRSWNIRLAVEVAWETGSSVITIATSPVLVPRATIDSWPSFDGKSNFDSMNY